MAAELVETSRLWGRQNAAIDPLWAERLGGDLVKRSYSEPHWSKKRAVRAGPRARHPVRRTAGRRPRRTRSAGTSPTSPASCSSGTRWCRASGTPGTASSRPTGGCWRRPRSSSTGRAATTSWSTRRRCSTSTTPGCRPRSSPAPTSTPGGSRSAARDPTCSPSTPRCWCTTAPTRCGRATSPTSGTRARSTLPLRYHFEPGHEADGVTIDVPLATLNTVGAAPFTWNVPGPAAGAGHRADPVAAQAAAGQLRAGPGRRPAVPRGGAAGGGAAASRRCRATCARSTGVHVPADAWDVDQGARRTCGPRSGSLDEHGRRGRRGQGPRGAQAAAAALLRPGHAAGRRRVRRERDRADRRGPSAPSSRRSPRRVRATRCTGSRRWSTRAAPSGCGWRRRPTSRRPSTGSAYDGCCCWRCRRPAASCWSRPGQRRQAGARRVAVPERPRARRRLRRSRPRASWSTRPRPVRDPEAFEALVERARAELPDASAAVLHQVLRVLAEWRPVDKALHGRVEMAMLPGDDRPARPARPAGARRVHRARPGPPRCASTRATSGR